MLDESVFHSFVHRVEFKYFNPFEYVRVTRQNLTHWQQPGVSYFLTYHLADAMPAVLLNQWKQERAIWLSFHPEPWTPEVEDEYHRRFSSQMERWLDAGHGSCVLRRPEVRAEVEESFRYFEGVRYQSFSWVIMPNHVHLLVMLHPDWTLEKVLFTWKRRTSGCINELCGTEGQQWQHDYFDRIIRDGQHFDNVVRYIRRNPAKAKLREGEYTLWESDEVKKVPCGWGRGMEGRRSSAPRVADHRHWASAAPWTVGLSYETANLGAQDWFATSRQEVTQQVASRFAGSDTSLVSVVGNSGRGASSSCGLSSPNIPKPPTHIPFPLTPASPSHSWAVRCRARARKLARGILPASSVRFRVGTWARGWARRRRRSRR